MDINKLKELMEMDAKVRRVVEQLSFALLHSTSGDKEVNDLVDIMKDNGLVVVPDDIEDRMAERFAVLRKIHDKVVDLGQKLSALELTDRDRLDALGVGRADGGTDLGMFMERVCTAVEKAGNHIVNLMETILENRAALDAIGFSTILAYYTPSLLIREAMGADGNILMSGTSDGVSTTANLVTEIFKDIFKED